MQKVPTGVRRRSRAIGAVMVALVAVAVPAALAFSAETEVTVGSPPSPFSQNKQNEPAVAIDANHPNVLVAGANDEVDMEACNAGDDTTCPFTPGVGVSGVYFSFDSGTTWTQPTYTGLTAAAASAWSATPTRTAPPHAGRSERCRSTTRTVSSPTATLPSRSARAGCERRASPGRNGSRLYYANLTSNVGATRSEQAFKGFEAIAVSRSDDVQAAAARQQRTRWSDPVIISKQSSTTFSDKEQIWADNASSSPFFGTVYVCWASFRGQEKGNAAPAPLIVAVSQDGGDTWTTQADQLGGRTTRSEARPTGARSGPTAGSAYVFGVGTSRRRATRRSS